MNAIHFGPHQPRWEPRSEGDLRTGIDDGLLAESHWLDLKRELGPGKRTNKELARDLASFAVDGGTLIVGVEETDNGPGLAPQPMQGLREKVDQSPAPSSTRPYGFLLTRSPPTATCRTWGIWWCRCLQAHTLRTWWTTVTSGEVTRRRFTCPTPRFGSCTPVGG